MDKQKRSLMRCMVAFVVLAFAITVFNITPVFADDASDTAQLVVQCFTLDNFLASKALPGFRDLLERRCPYLPAGAGRAFCFRRVRRKRGLRGA